MDPTPEKTPYGTVPIDDPASLRCGNRFGSFFGVPQAVFDRVWSRLTDPRGNSVIYVSMEIGADLDVYFPLALAVGERDPREIADPRTRAHVEKVRTGPRKIPNYSGGLGVLAGDTLKSLADLRVPVAAVSLLYREGYFSQFVDSKAGQIDQATYWSPEETPSLFQLRDPDDPARPLELEVDLGNGTARPIRARAQVWMKLETNGALDSFVPEFLLDYSITRDPAWIREAALRLYTAKSIAIKANQRRLLGLGILPLMEALGLTGYTIHLNEQHGVAVTLQLILRELNHRLGPDYVRAMQDQDILDAAAQVARRIVYTIHTPVKAGHDTFPRSVYRQFSREGCERVLDLLAADSASPEIYNFTAMAMRVNRAVNAVSRLHRDVTRKQFPQFAEKISAITNGVHHLTWISPQRARLFDAVSYLEGWQEYPDRFAAVRDHLGDERLRQGLQEAWAADNARLVAYVNEMLLEHRRRMTETWIDPPNYLSHLPADNHLAPGVFTIGFARRFSTYKRADLIFEDIDTLASILLEGDYRINFIFSGKAHPDDEPGKSLLKLILDSQEALYEKSRGLAKLVFIPGYDMAIAKMMVAGVHAWLNNPKRPLEASGTSGMKAAMNGVPNISVMDGWWVEGYHDGQTGWKFGYEGPVEDADLREDADALLYQEDSLAFYRILPEILETFYRRPEKYLDKALMNLCLNVPIFNTHRMAAEYCSRYNLVLPPDVAARLDLFRSLYASDPQTPSA